MTTRDVTRAARLLGRRGGQATAERLTPEQRTANARQAVNARWSRVRDAAATGEPAEPSGDETTRETLVRINKKNADFWGEADEL